MASLPSRCILLLEDIDAAGLVRDESKRKSRCNVSLSAVLNAIDGVSSPEGRILIMTTNHVESLDHALIRPGRVDMHVSFEHPTKLDVINLFIGIYQVASKKKSTENEKNSTVALVPQDGKKAKEEDIEELAREFAAILPENRFSFAAIQGYLLKYKNNARAAVENAPSWIKEMSQIESKPSM
jgi:mitochondrial chaperone BCS1